MNDEGKTGIRRKRSGEESLGKIAFFGMLLISVVVSAVCVVTALKWVGRQFPGFLLNERIMVAPVGQYHWTGAQNGLKYPDRILSANGKEIKKLEDLNGIITRTAVGTPISYVVNREATQFSVTVQTMQFTWFDLLMTFGITFITGLAYMMIGAIVYIMKPNRTVSWSFFIACFFLSMLSITIFDMQATHFGFIRFYLLANCLAPAAFLHFSMFFPEPGSFVKDRPYLQVIPYAICLLIVIPMQIFYPSKPFQIFYSLVQLYSIVSALFLLYPIVTVFFKHASALARQRAKIVLIGASIAFPIPTAAYFSQLFLGSFLGLRIQTNQLMLPVLIFPASIAYAIARHNLFDVDIYIKRAVGYVLMTAIVIGGYALVSIPLNIVLGHYELAQSRAFPILFTLVVILVFNPLYTRIQTFVDRVFFRKEYNYGEIVEKVTNAMTSLLDLTEILKRLVTTFTEDLFINTSSVMLMTPEGTGYRVFMSEGESKERVETVSIDRKAPLMEVIEKQKKEITKFEVAEDPKYQDISEGCIKNFEDLNATLMVPLVYQDNVIGLLNLGEKKSGKFFSREDVDLARTLASQGAMAIENARMVEEVIEKERMEEELNIARDLQVSMLPSVTPQIKGFDIAAYSLAAREVGGDFYDFIEMGEEKAGIIIGDVTGKSVSGALVMSASRTLFRILSEEERPVKDNMTRANRRLKKDVKSGMFVALMYAVADSQTKTLTLCSAGQTQPVYLSVKTGTASLIQTSGDTFPLGILEDAEYEDTVLQLEAGDTVVLYTDGIVEEMNEKEEMFGFERLLDFVQTFRAPDSKSLLEGILKKVKEFAGQGKQHDDLTAIVIKAL